MRVVYEVCFDYLCRGDGDREESSSLEEANAYAKWYWDGLDDEDRKVIDVYVQEGWCADEDDYPNEWEVFDEDFDCWRDLTEAQIQSRVDLRIIDEGQAEGLRKKCSVTGLCP